jgi:hypothetical protein
MAAVNIRAMYRLKESVKAALGEDNMYGAPELVEVYGRLREQARELNERAGWSTEDFEKEMPTGPSGGRQGGGPRALLDRNARIRMLLGQLGAWAEGNVQVFEFERKLEIEAKAKAAASQKPPVGFSSSN